jgi:ribosomal protein S18 acetylase RimI-like enzyme
VTSRRRRGDTIAPVSDEEIRIESFRDEHGAAFAWLNREWLVGYGLWEPIDGEYLDDPRGHFLDAGGAIYVALRGDEVVGTCALLPAGEDFELSKLTVATSARGHGLGRRLTEAVVAHARRLGARRVILSSNSGLTTAIALYEAMGFRHVPPHGGIAYAAADTFMALDLGPAPKG